MIGINELVSYGTNCSNKQASNSIIWRIDPTGQFWNCQGAAVGRGAGQVEAAMLKLVQDWKYGRQKDTINGANVSNNKSDDHDQYDDLDKVIRSISNDDVKQCFRSMTFDEAVKFTCDCIRKVHKEPDIEDFKKLGIQGLLIPSYGDKGRKYLKPEMIHPTIISECLHKSTTKTK